MYTQMREHRLVDLRAQASCTTWLETAAAQQKKKTTTKLLVRLVRNAISNTRKAIWTNCVR